MSGPRDKNALIAELRSLDPPAANEFLVWSGGKPAWASATPPIILRVPIYTDPSAPMVLTNHPNSEQFLENHTRCITKADLSSYTQVRLLARVIPASGSPNSPRVYLEYSTTFSLTEGDYSDIGTSAVSCSLSSAGMIDSGWVDLVSGAKADVFLAVLQNGGNGVADPGIGNLTAEFR